MVGLTCGCCLLVRRGRTFAHRFRRRSLVVTGQPIARLGYRLAFRRLRQRDFTKCTKQSQQRDYSHLSLTKKSHSPSLPRFSVILLVVIMKSGVVASAGEVDNSSCASAAPISGRSATIKSRRSHALRRAG